ncbi:hypothetical protein EMCRGX_G004980 [Ephydatia muelleri]
MTGNKAALVERLYLHLQDPSSEPEPEREDVPDATPSLEDSSESSSKGATTESTSYIFNQFTSALHWIMATNYAADLIHYLDDFLLDKLEGPVTTITFLGITIDTTLQQLRFPPDKLQEMTLLIKSWLRKHKTTKWDLRSLIGKLSYAAKVDPSGRLFLRQLIELSSTVSKLHHHIHLNMEAREDIIIWWNRPTHSQPQYFLSWQSSKPSDGDAPQQSTAPSTFNMYQTGIRSQYNSPTTENHSHTA